MASRAVFVAALALLPGQLSHAQRTPASAVIETSAEALGMVRGVQRQMDSINTVQFSGTGTMRVPEGAGRWTRFEVTNVTVGMSYFIPAMRWDMQRRGPDGSEQRTIHVVRGERAWDEELPGMGATPVTGQVSERLRQIWLTPHGVIRAAVEAAAEDPGAVTVATQAGRTTLTVDIDGMPVTATLDAAHRPERVELTIEHPVLGRTVLAASYADYKDWPILDVYFPSRIVHRLGGETTLDLTVTSFYQNPYVVFPTPEELSRSAQ